MNVSLFQPCSVDYGDKKSRGMALICGKCGGVGKVPMNSVMVGGGNDDRQTELMAMRKFSHLGWEIGKQPTRHRCPSCIAKTKPFASLSIVKNSKEEPVKPTGNGLLPPLDPVAMKTVASPAMGPSMKVMAMASPTVGGLTRDDRRIVFARLNDCYDTERTGYRGGWTDAKVAKDLGVPVEWVKEVREDLLGPDTNIAAAEQIAASKEVVAKINAFLEEVRVLNEKAEPLREQLEKHEADIAALQKTLAA